MAELESEARRVLEAAGLRCTTPRLQSVACLATLPRHFGAEEALQALRSGPRAGVSRATLYRLLGELERHGVLRRVLLSEGHSHYEFVGDRGPHCHVVCARCGRVEEVHSPALERIVRRLGVEHGFGPREAEIEISVDSCRQCAAAAPAGGEEGANL